MRRRTLIVFAILTVSMAFAGPVSADPADNSPNAYTDIFYCESGAEYELTIPSINGSTASLEFEGRGNVAVSKSMYFFDSEAAAAVGPEGGEEIWTGPPGIRAQDKTTWCWWNPFDLEGFWVGNHLMFVKK